MWVVLVGAQVVVVIRCCSLLSITVRCCPLLCTVSKLPGRFRTQRLGQLMWRQPKTGSSLNHGSAKSFLILLLSIMFLDASLRSSCGSLPTLLQSFYSSLTVLQFFGRLGFLMVSAVKRERALGALYGYKSRLV